MKKIVLFVFVLMGLNSGFSQELSKFNVGVSSGGYFASKKTAYLYDGIGPYGITWVYSNPNIKPRIDEELVYDYKLGAAPLDMRYSPSLSIGAIFSLVLDSGDELFLSGDVVRLDLKDAYTVEVENPQNAIQTDIREFAILGKEERLNIDFGYKAFISTENPALKPFMIFGVNALYTEFKSNTIYVGNLGPYSIFNEQFWSFNQNVRNSGWGFGAFTGFGMRFPVADGTALELDYKLNLAQVRIADVRQWGFHNVLSVRVVWGR
jgi:hypothetical protein